MRCEPSSCNIINVLLDGIVLAGDSVSFAFQEMVVSIDGYILVIDTTDELGFIAIDISDAELS